MSSPKIELFAATGTILPATETCDSFQNQNKALIYTNFAASGTLARQIKAGAEADIFISANKEWIDYLMVNKLLRQEAVSTIASNKLVLVCYKNNNTGVSFSKNFDIQHLKENNFALGDPNYVPAGKYAKQVLDSLGWYTKLENQVILTKDVTSVLHLVEQQECDWGILYYSEAIKSDKVKIHEIPQNLYDPIIFYIAKLNNEENTIKLFEYFNNYRTKEIFNKYGFN